MGSSNLLVLEDNFRGKTKAKLLIPSFIDTKRTFPVLLYPMEVRMMVSHLQFKVPSYDNFFLFFSFAEQFYTYEMWKTY